jgi:hypothetical protein
MIWNAAAEFVLILLFPVVSILFHIIQILVELIAGQR